ncbi:MAG: DNA polymerase III subunit epsilon [Burkholderiales bacterium]|jgi:DNA polymerase-3 subunit epsilon|nr:DNA polymerase III subunit epsilon [Burkholderiales bacterium]
MRQIVLDTETTGLEPRDGHRIIEIGALEIVGRRIVEERRLHLYLNPEREIDEGALAVHGITAEFLADKPKFVEVVDELLAFVADAEVIIHNAAFDVGFLDAELARAGRGSFAAACAKVTDSLLLARSLHPGKRNSLDALCERYAVSNAHRTLHGALLDAGLLADVYLAMTRGQDTLAMDLARAVDGEGYETVDPASLLVLTASDEEAATHEAVLARLAKDAKGGAIWPRQSAAAAS